MSKRHRSLETFATWQQIKESVCIFRHDAVLEEYELPQVQRFLLLFSQQIAPVFFSS